MGGKRKTKSKPKYYIDQPFHREKRATITDENHLEQLDIGELLTAVTKNPHLIAAARSSFGRKFSTRKIRIGDHQSTPRNETKIAEKDALNFLRVFGASVKKLLFDPVGSTYKEIEQCIVENCTNSLIEFELPHCRKYAMSAMTKPFTRIEILRIEHGYVPCKIGHFHSWFPSLRRLELIENKVVNPKCIQHHISTLEHLTIEVGGSKKDFKPVNIERCLQLNQQLQSLYLHYGHNADLYHEMEWDSDDDVEIVSTTNSLNVKKLIVHIHESYCPRNIYAPNFQQLVEFELVSEHELDIFDGIMQFLAKNECLTKVKLIAESDFVEQSIFKSLMKLTQLKQLKEVETNMGIISMDEAVSFIQKCVALTKLRIRVERDLKRRVFRKRLGADWVIISHDCDNIFDSFFMHLFMPNEDLTIQRKI